MIGIQQVNFEPLGGWVIMWKQYKHELGSKSLILDDIGE